MRYLTALILFTATVLSVFGQDYSQWIYALHDGEIQVLGEGSLSIELTRGGVGKLHPTPGGKYVYVSYAGSDLISVVDVETHAEAWTFSLGFEPGDIVFSQMGETAFISVANSDEIRVFRHRAGTFEYQSSVSAGSPDTPFAINRRGTRVYRPEGTHVHIVYVKTGEVLDEVDTQAVPEALNITPDYREIWVVGDDGTLVVIDEARGNVRKRVDPQAAPGQIHFDRANGYLLDGEGQAVVAVSRRNLRSKEYYRMAAPTLDFAIDRDGEVWPSPEGAFDIAYVVVRAGEGFACF